jgi:hypothetical protein
MPSFGELETVWRRRAFDDVGEGGTEDLWTFTDFSVALAEAEEQWCRRTLGLSDYSSSFLHLTGAMGDSEFTLDQRILEIKRVKPDTTPILKLASLDEMDLYNPNWETALNDTPVYYMTDVNINKLWIVPALAADDTIQLTVARLPLTSPCVANPVMKEWERTDTLEILPVYHYDLLDWVTYRLYDFQSRQTERPQALWNEKAREAYQRFEAKFGIIPGSQAETVRQEGYPRERQFGRIPDSKGDKK